MTVPINVNKFDPFGLTEGPARAVAPVVRTGTITFDQDYGEHARYLYVGTSGDLSYVEFDGTTETLPNAAAGIWHWICSIRVNSSGTTIAANQLRWGS
jgi:hypothetical protein